MNLTIDMRASGRAVELGRVYVAGPMGGYPEFNYPAFYRMEEALKRLGWEVVNPASIDEADDVAALDFEAGAGVGAAERARFLRADVAELARCDAIVMLDGWERSAGANAELLIARILDLAVFVEDWEADFKVGPMSPAPILRPLMGGVWQHINELEGDAVYA